MSEGGRERNVTVSHGGQLWQASFIREVLSLLLIVAVTFAAYSSTFSAGYIWDDNEYVVSNSNLHNFQGLIRTWTDKKSNPQYYPLVFTTFWIEHHFWENRPTGYHLVNVALHALTAVCVVRLLRRLQIRAAWFCGLLFAIHPVHVESVAWITERKNVLSGLLYLLGAIYFLRFARIDSENVAISHPKRRNRTDLIWYLLSLLLFIAALLSKSVTCSLPAALLLVLWWKEELSPRNLVSLVPFFLIGAFFGLQTAALEKDHVLAIGPEWDLSFAQRWIIAGRSVWFYLQKLVLPIDLSFNYSRWQPDSLCGWQHIFPITVLVVLALLWGLRRRIGKGPCTAACYFVGTLFPALGFFNIYPMRFSFVADHFQYLASIGPLALFAAVVARWNRTNEPTANARSGIARSLAILVVMILFLLTFFQARNYRDLETLWKDTIAKNPESFLAHNNLADLLMTERRVQEALPHYEMAVALKPDDYRPHFGLAQVLEKIGDAQRAQKEYEQSIELDETKPNVRFQYGQFLLSLSRLTAAQSQFEASIRLDPMQRERTHIDALIILGNLAVESKHLGDAERYYRSALELDPNSKLARENLQRILEK